MKIKQGMYIRTNEGRILKITNDAYKGTSEFFQYTDGREKGALGKGSLEKIIKSASHNLKDLIEIWDIVNNVLVMRNYDKHLDEFAVVDVTYPRMGNWIKRCDLPEIKSIVTHEQLDRIKFEVVQNA